MVAPRKTAAKRAPAKASPRVDKIDAFEQFRRRGQKSQLVSGHMAGPFIVPGFNPPVAAAFPTQDDLILLERLDRAWRTRDAFEILRVLLGSEYDRVITMFNSQPDSFKLLVGLADMITDHFMGRGASDVPGGSPAS